MPVVVLVHSPVVGPAVWSGVAAALRTRGLAVAVPPLSAAGAAPHWQRHAAEVAASVQPEDTELVLAGHSGAGPLLPEWGDEQIAPLVPDAEQRRGLLADLRPQGLEFYTEPIPVPAGWSRCPAGFLQLDSGYAVYAEQARAAGWPVRIAGGGHFALLVQPERVADAMVEMLAA